MSDKKELYPRIFFDYDKSSKYHGCKINELIITKEYQNNIPCVVWYKNKPLTKKQMDKMQVSFNEIKQQTYQFEDEYTWTKLKEDAVKVSGKKTGAAIILHPTVKKKLEKELGLYCVMLYDDKSIYAMKIDGDVQGDMQEEAWLEDVFHNYNKRPNPDKMKPAVCGKYMLVFGEDDTKVYINQYW